MIATQKFHCYDEKIFNHTETTAGIIDKAHKNDTVILDCLGEGVPIETITYHDKTLLDVLNELCRSNNWPKEKFQFMTGNLVQDLSVWPNIVIKNGHIVDFFLGGKDSKTSREKNFTHYFGSLINGSNYSRLWMASQLFKKHRDKTWQTFRMDPKNPGHAVNLDLDRMMFYFSSQRLWKNQYLHDIADLLSHSPIHKHSDRSIFVDFSNVDNDVWHDECMGWYNRFFCDIVTNTFVTGSQFNLDEKLGRAVYMKNPFIVMGPKNYLANLRKIGFRTFSKYWDESYDWLEGPARCLEIMKVIDRISAMSMEQIKEQHNNMQDLLEHNLDVYENLTKEKIIEIFGLIDIIKY
jgi:hypothetical protein